MLHINNKLMQQLDGVEFAYSKDRMSAASVVFGDPGLAHFIELEPLFALMAPAIPNPYFNRIFVSASSEPEKLTSILDAFSSKSAEPIIDINPGALTASYSKVLSSHGFAQTDFHPIFVRKLANWSLAPSPLKTRIVSTQDELRSFQELYVQGWDASPGFAGTMKKFIEKWMSYSGWHLFLAFDGDVPISAAVLFVHNNIAYLADATTPPSFRGRGGQMSLLTARAEQAKALGCDIIFSRADFGSTSHKNMEKSGLPMAYTRAVWKHAT